MGYGTSFSLQTYANRLQISDPDGDAIQFYEISLDPSRVDMEAWVLEGQPLGKYLIPADKFNTIKFYGSVLGSNPVVVRAFDGKEWSDPKSFNINVVPSSNTGGVAITPGNGGSPSTTSPSPTPAQPISGKGVTIRTGANGGTLIGGGGITGIKPTLDWLDAKIKQLTEDINKNQKEIDNIKKIPFWEWWPGNNEKVSQLERQKKELEETRQGKDEFEKNNGHYIRMQKWTDEDWKSETSQETSINRVNSDINKLYAELSSALVGKHYNATVGYIYDTDYYQAFGIPRNIGYHDGIDIDTPNTPGQQGTPVKVLVGGNVRKLSYSGGDTGLGLVVAGDDGRYYHYVHLSSADVTSGRIEAGQTIGYVGNTNVAALSHHLHFQVNKTAKTDEGGGNPSPPAYNIHSQSDVANWTLNPLKVFFDLKWQGKP